MSETASYYMKLPYNRIIRATGEPGDIAYFAEVEELECCYAEGATEEEAFKNLEEIMFAYISGLIRRGKTPNVPAVKQAEIRLEKAS